MQWAWAEVAFALVVILLANCVDLSSAQQPARRMRLLVVTHSAGFMHEPVRRPAPDKLSVCEEVIMGLGLITGAYDCEFIYTKEDCQKLTPDYLKQFDGFFFYATGNLPIPEDGRKALIELVKEGKGFIGAHAATDAWYNYQPYGEMIGAYFDGHPWHQKVRVIVEDKQHPATAHLGDAFEIVDEIYQFREPYSRERLHILLSLDINSVDVKKGKRKDNDYALAWVQQFGKGRVFYTALGHGNNVWRDERFQKHLLNGILWALGVLK
jgi:type 1 glutamine amidotransferase